jgi:4-amino-4-deoxyprephenate dehydrogenase
MRLPDTEKEGENGAENGEKTDVIGNAVVLGGAGQAGKLLARSLGASGIAVTLVDMREPEHVQKHGAVFLRCDIGECGPELNALLARADCVCVCLPEAIALASAAKLTDSMTEGSLWVDTLSIKGDIVRALASERGRLEAVSLNPMFAPAMGWEGNAVALVTVADGTKSALFKQMLAGWGARLEEVTAEDHDRLTAAIQVATHASVLSFGAALLELKFDLDKALRLATPPHRLLLTLLYRMATQNPDVYWDIQTYHPEGGAVRKALLQALEDLQADAARHEGDRLYTMLRDWRALFATHENTFREWSTRAFALPDV